MGKNFHCDENISGRKRIVYFTRLLTQGTRNKRAVLCRQWKVS
jgi:hypothetical protein